MRSLRVKMCRLLLAHALGGVPLAAAEPVELTLSLGRGAVIDCADGIARVSTSSPEIVDVVTASTREVLFDAKAVGQATVIVWSKTGERTTYNVAVELNLAPMRSLLRESFPDEEI